MNHRYVVPEALVEEGESADIDTITGSRYDVVTLKNTSPPGVVEGLDRHAFAGCRC
jgi:hypothetical protein